MDNQVYLTNGEVAKMTGVSPCHIARDFSKARKKTYIFCGRKCQSYLKEDVIKIKEQINARRKTAEQRYASRPKLLTGKTSKYKNILDAKEYIKLRNAWYGMMRRCYTNERPDYHHYREKRISMCEEWLKDFDLFVSWSLSNGFNLELSIDRIDNNSGYSPENCRWADKRTQNNNSSQNKYYEYNGVKRTIGEWAFELNINYDTLFNRIHYLGWSIDKALSTPVRKINKSS